MTRYHTIVENGFSACVKLCKVMKSCFLAQRTYSVLFASVCETGLNGAFGSINVLTNTSTTLQFCFEANGMNFTMDPFVITWFDLDNHPMSNRQESVRCISRREYRGAACMSLSLYPYAAFTLSKGHVTGIIRARLTRC